ncbi:MAG: TonB-dependent receptor [Myxococcales bacterium]|nr:TonB-dependent receptor [Myxococcales bacterium]
MLSSTDARPTTPREKALAINLDARRYGTFAEIGAGQEVVRWFFRVGGAAGTIAKSISAYDMTVSDAIYGRCERYVCRERLEAMLEYEQRLNLERLAERRSRESAFFTFADTVTTRRYDGGGECHGWMGVTFQSHPRDEASQILLHVRMLDDDAAAQQEALGIVGVNLLYGAFSLYTEPELLIESLLDGLSTKRIEIDMIEFSGIEFRNVDNRVMSLRLVELGLTGAAMFSAEGCVLQPSEALYKRPVLVERGSFRPVTHVNVDMLERARAEFSSAHEGEHGTPLALMELNLQKLREEGELDLADFVGRADVLAATGHAVLISDFYAYARLVAYLRRYTQAPLALVMGAGSLRALLDEENQRMFSGGVLESFGRMLTDRTSIYVYPYRDPETGARVTASNLGVDGAKAHLGDYLRERGSIRDLEGVGDELLAIWSREVLAQIRAGTPGWEEAVPAGVAQVIKEHCFFGYRPAA